MLQLLFRDYFISEGEIGVAKAAEKFGTMFGISSLGTASIEEISNLVKTPKTVSALCS